MNIRLSAFETNGSSVAIAGLASQSAAAPCFTNIAFDFTGMYVSSSVCLFFTHLYTIGRISINFDMMVVDRPLWGGIKTIEDVHGFESERSSFPIPP
jgi:hypothetical protein